MGTPVSRAIGWIATLVGALLAAVLVAPATPAEGATTTPCAAGTPVVGDLDGDGGADLLISDGDRYRWVPSDGTAAVWLDIDTRRLRTADLNGDVCADAITPWGNHLRFYLGTPDGLDPAHPVLISLPRSDLDLESGMMGFSFAGMRHHGISQLVVAGGWDFDGYLYSTFLDVVTLDATAHVASVQSFELAEQFGTDSWDDLYPVVADDGVIALGDPGALVGGAVYVFSPDAANPATTVFRTALTQNSPGVPGGAEKWDRFGEALSLRDGRLAIGAPGEDVGKVKDAGLVQPIRWHADTNSYTAHRSISQNTSGVPGTSEKNDRFGSSLTVTRGLTAAGSYDIAIGAPDEKVAGAATAGSVTVGNFTKKLFRTYTQNTARVPGSAERDDGFGDSVAALRTRATTDTLLIGAPLEKTAGCTGRGYVIRTDGNKLSSTTRWQQLATPACADDSYWGSDFGG